VNENQFRSDKSLWTRIAESIFGVPPRKTLTKMDIHDLNGVVHIGDYQVSKEEALDIAVEIIRRANR